MKPFKLSTKIHNEQMGIIKQKNRKVYIIQAHSRSPKSKPTVLLKAIIIRNVAQPLYTNFTDIAGSQCERFGN
jgi:hypothetical protein